MKRKAVTKEDIKNYASLYIIDGKYYIYTRTVIDGKVYVNIERID